MKTNLQKAMKLFQIGNVCGDKIQTIKKINDNTFLINDNVIKLDHDENSLMKAISIFIDTEESEDEIYFIQRITDTLFRINDKEVNILTENISFYTDYSE